MYGADNRPLLSWRVLILPYLSEEELFKEFHLDEPWDSKHNIQLLSRMPKSYDPPWKSRVHIPPYHTIYHVLVGPGTPFEKDRPFCIPHPLSDETSGTILFVEAGNPVPWTKPEEIAFGPAHRVILKGLFGDGFRACDFTGKYRFIRHDTDYETLCGLLRCKSVEAKSAR